MENFQSSHSTAHTDRGHHFSYELQYRCPRPSTQRRHPTETTAKKRQSNSSAPDVESLLAQQEEALRVFSANRKTTADNTVNPPTTTDHATHRALVTKGSARSAKQSYDRRGRPN